jgi:uncharacterized protein (TIGR02271 family)
MMSYDTHAGTRRTITAFFDSREDATEAVERLVQAGIPRSGINVVAGAQGTQAASVSREGEGLGFWEALKDLFLPDEDRATYAEGLRRGGFVVTVQADAAHYERAIDILDDEGTVDLEERAAGWRQEGWTGEEWRRASSGATGAFTAGGASGVPRTRSSEMQSGAARQASAGREEVVPVAEEQLRVGKREVSHGRVKVRSYVVEQPVQEQVNLRQEHVDVERRRVDRPATAEDRLFQGRVIEAEEKAEEAVVGKEARVKEELVVKKGVEQQTQTVSDKVRRMEVEVEDERGKKVRSTDRDKA